MVSSESDSTILISWSSPAIPNGQIIRYSVRIFDLKNNVEITELNSGNGDQNNFTRMNLGMSISNIFMFAEIILPEL